MHPALLRIRLLGEVDLRVEDQPPFGLRSRRAESLLAYLLLHRDAPQPRQRLAFLLWPDSTESQARTNLRHLLHTLRQALPGADRFIDITSRTLQWREDAPFWLDVAAFEDCLLRTDDEPGVGDTLPALREAASIYRRDLLEGHYDEWLIPEREQLRSRYREVLERLVQLLSARGHLAETITYAERLVRWDPLREEPYRVLMGLHDANGDRARALRVYHACAVTLERELGVEPSPASRHAYETLLLREAAEPGGRDTARRGSRGRPLIGRAAERAQLTRLWRTASRGVAQLVLVTGEPGVGKTGLVEDFRSWCEHQGTATAEARSYRAEGELAFGPVTSWLRSEALAPGLERLDSALLAEISLLLPELRSDRPDLLQPTQVTGGDQRQVMFHGLAKAILASGRPLLLVADDLHWADRDTLQFLHYLLRKDPKASLLVVATARREDMGEDHPLDDLLTGIQNLDRATEIRLERFTEGETALLAAHELGRPMEEARAARLHAETEGNPLFVIESLRAGWTGEAGERARMTPKVQAVIQERLRRLSEPARELVGVAATVGRAFTSDVVQEASQVPPQQVVRALDELWRRGLIREQGTDAYDFSHDKIRESAYHALSPAQRRHHHLGVARVLERSEADEVGLVSAQLAAHYDRAGEPEHAVRWYEQAAAVAQRMQAHVEAIRLLQRGIELIGELPPTSEHRSLELALLTALQAPLGVVEGYSSTLLEDVRERALELARELRVDPAPPLLYSSAISSLSRGDFDGAKRAAERLRAGGRRGADAAESVQAEYVLGIAAFWKAEFAVARQHFQAAVGGHRPEQVPIHLLRFGLDPKVICLSRLGNTLWFLGWAAAATRAREAALALADEIGHPHSRGSALVFGALLALEVRDAERVREYTAALEAEVTRQSRPIQVMSEAFGGYVDVLEGRHRIGMTRIRKAVDDSARAEHAPGLHGTIVRLLLAACVAAGDARTGAAAAQQLLGLGGAAVVWESEAHRLRGRFLSDLDASHKAVEVHLHAALLVARRQQARSLELRAATSLLRFHLDQRNQREVGPSRELVAATIAALPEPTQTVDLLDAASLLPESTQTVDLLDAASLVDER